MPPQKVDYSKTIIYKICCNDLLITDVYVGHTTEFIKRKYCHKNNCNNPNIKSYNLKVYQIIRANGGWDNWTMVEIEKYSCKDGNEAGARERYWYELLNAKMNKYVPNRSNRDSMAAYRQANRTILNEQQSLYYKANKTILNEKANIKIVCGCGGNYTRANKSSHLKTKKHIDFCNTVIV
jgi:hypothetical protein